MKASILSLATAVPAYSFSQNEIGEKLIDMLSIDPEKAKTIRQFYQNSGINRRYSVLPDFLKERHAWDFWGKEFPNIVPGMTQRNDLYKIEAPKLAYDAALKALESWGGDPNTITHIISVSCTGMVAPGIEFELMKLLKLKPSTQRLGINFMGCFGAFKGLAVAQSFAKEDPQHRVLLVCTELCSLHFQAEQTSDNHLGNSLFADGAAAVIIGADPRTGETSLWEIEKKSSLGLDNTKDKMHWEASNQGFLMKLSYQVPVLLGRNIAAFVDSLIDGKFAYIDCEWAIHPGGKSIIQAIEKALKLDKNLTQASWDTLGDYGNMSSATFLFVLEKLLQKNNSKKWTVGVAFGPGLSIEGLILKRPEII